MSARPALKIPPWVRVTAGVLLLGVIVASGVVDLRPLQRVTWGVPLWTLIGTAVVALLATSIRWAVLACTFTSAPVDAALRVGVGSQMLVVLTPAGAGADALRAVYLVRSGHATAGEAATLAIVDRLLGLHALLLCGAVAAALGNAAVPFTAGLAAGAVVTLGITLAAVFRKTPLLPGRLGAWATLRPARGGRPEGGYAAAYGWSMLAAVTNGLLPFLGVAAVTSGALKLSAAAGSVVVTLLNSIAPTPGGLGAGELAAVAMFRASGAGGAGMLLTRAVLICVALLFTLVWMVLGMNPRKALVENAL